MKHFFLKEKLQKSTQRRFMYKYLLISIFTVFIFSGCDQEKIQKLDPQLLQTNLGKIKDQKMITKLPPKKVVKKVTKPKKINLTVQQKKQRYIDIMVPIVTEVYKQLDNQYKDVKKDISLNRNHEFIDSLKKFYEVEDNEKLLQALKPHPISIVLAQGAIESAWLTSRFAKVANNIFGVWSFRSNEPRIAANATRGEKKIYLKKYKNYKSAIYDYYKNLAKNWAYEDFRTNRVVTNDPYVLSDYLVSYSEKREAYTKMLKRMIEYNNFDQYDIK